MKRLATILVTLAVILANSGSASAYINNSRDAMKSTGHHTGIVYRSGNLCHATRTERANLAKKLAGGTIIDLRTNGTVLDCPDPSLPGVTRVHYPISSDANYVKYVTDKPRRDAFAAAINQIAHSAGPIQVHCSAGKDRTGWLIAMTLYAIGATDAQALKEYKLTTGAPIDKYNAGLAAIKTNYGSVSNYLTQGLKLTPETITALKTRIG